MQEQKQAIINQAVTKGLDPHAEMKDSGIDWLGRIPKHWTVNRLKRFCKINPSISHLLNMIADNSEVTFLPMENISVDGKIDDCIKQKLSTVKNGFTSFAKNDVVIAKITPCFENGKGACLDKLSTPIGFGTTELIVLRSNEGKISPRFLYYITMLAVFRKKGAEVMTGSAGQKRVPTNFVAEFSIGIPNIKEQQNIVIFLDQKCVEINSAIKRIKTKIDLILEYRNTIISAAATGQIDLRKVIVESVASDDFPLDAIDEPESDDTESLSAKENEE